MVALDRFECLILYRRALDMTQVLGYIMHRSQLDMLMMQEEEEVVYPPTASWVQKLHYRLLVVGGKVCLHLFVREVGLPLLQRCCSHFYCSKSWV